MTYKCHWVLLHGFVIFVLVPLLVTCGPLNANPKLSGSGNEDGLDLLPDVIQRRMVPKTDREGRFYGYQPLNPAEQEYEEFQVSIDEESKGVGSASGQARENRWVFGHPDNQDYGSHQRPPDGAAADTSRKRDEMENRFLTVSESIGNNPNPSVVEGKEALNVYMAPVKDGVHIGLNEAQVEGQRQFNPRPPPNPSLNRKPPDEMRLPSFNEDNNPFAMKFENPPAEAIVTFNEPERETEIHWGSRQDYLKLDTDTKNMIKRMGIGVSVLLALGVFCFCLTASAFIVLMSSWIIWICTDTRRGEPGSFTNEARNWRGGQLSMAEMNLLNPQKKGSMVRGGEQDKAAAEDKDKITSNLEEAAPEDAGWEYYGNWEEE